MDLNNTTVALCGTFEDTFLSVLHSKNITVKSWSPYISALILGDDAEGRWKYKQAQRRRIRMIPACEFLDACECDLWVDKYKPTKLSEIIGHVTQVNDMIRWLQGWSVTMTEPRAAFVTGPPGIGKTTAVHLVARACGYEIVELNASNERSASAVKRWFEEASRSYHVGKKRVVIMDEVDGMSSGDRGGIGELARILKKCTFPMICIANERSPRMAPLAKACLELRFARPTKQSIAKAIFKIVNQNINVTQAELEDLCERNGNDIRQILNYLQFQSRSLGKTTPATKDALQRMDAFSATGRLFSRSGTLEDKSNLVFVDFGLVPLMVSEGYIAAAGRGSDDLMEHCVRAADYLGSYDMIDHRIRKTQNWSLLPSSVMMVVGAAEAAHGPAPFQIFPSALGKISKTNKHKRWLRDMRCRGGFGSHDAVLDARDLLRTRLFKSGGDAKAIVDDLIHLGLTRDDMLETLVETVFTGDEASIALDTKTKAAVSREWRKLDRDSGASACACAAEEEDAADILSEDECEYEY
jgi:replication factor C subunit 1